MEKKQSKESINKVTITQRMRAINKIDEHFKLLNRVASRVFFSTYLDNNFLGNLCHTHSQTLTHPV